MFWFLAILTCLRVRHWLISSKNGELQRLECNMRGFLAGCGLATRVSSCLIPSWQIRPFRFLIATFGKTYQGVEILGLKLQRDHERRGKYCFCRKMECSALCTHCVYSVSALHIFLACFYDVYMIVAYKPSWCVGEICQCTDKQHCALHARISSRSMLVKKMPCWIGPLHRATQYTYVQCHICTRKPRLRVQDCWDDHNRTQKLLPWCGAAHFKVFWIACPLSLREGAAAGTYSSTGILSHRITSREQLLFYSWLLENSFCGAQERHLENQFFCGAHFLGNKFCGAHVATPHRTVSSLLHES